MARLLPFIAGMAVSAAFASTAVAASYDGLDSTAKDLGYPVKLDAVFVMQSRSQAEAFAASVRGTGLYFLESEEVVTQSQPGPLSASGTTVPAGESRLTSRKWTFKLMQMTLASEVQWQDTQKKLSALLQDRSYGASVTLSR
ncbi:hypothetical protein ACO0LO_19170 [Undibacterium sp. TJN25]|uniref:hypothetical protein n=1 Tax=Undibacterium sp. TJN25 TaxID=3413056 RepID=UPI003BEFC367